MLRKQLRPALLLTLLLCFVAGILFPGIITGVAQSFFSHRTNPANGRVVGSTVIDKEFTQPSYFHPSSSAAGAVSDATARGGTNKGQTDSASGVDPLISPADAHEQVARIAAARRVSVESVQAIVIANTEGRQFGFFGVPRVNVLLLNIALDSAFRRPASAPRAPPRAAKP
jgi:potassium-transporting ATPase KdpC subunit